MLLAIEEAKKALNHSDIPVGAVIVKNGEIIATAHNTKEEKNNPTHHAEINVITKACNKLGRWRLSDCDLYVTLEPCVMCTGAILESRIKSVYFGAYDKSRGAMGTVLELSALKQPSYPIVYGGIMEDECSKILNNHFKNSRTK